MVLIAEDVAQHGILLLARVLDKTHCDTADRLLHRHAGVHKGESACTYSGHGRRTVRLEYLAHEAHCVRIVLRYLTLQTAPCKVTVANLAAAYATLCLGLAGTERWEVIVKDETHVALVEHVVHHFLVELGAKRTGSERLCLTTGEDRASVWHWQRAYLTPDRTYLVGLAAVKTNALVENATAHGVAHHVVVVAVCLGSLLFEVILAEVAVSLGIFCLEVFDYLVEGVLTSMLVESLLGNVVNGLVEFLVDLLAEVLVVYLMVVLALHVLAQFL